MQFFPKLRYICKEWILYILFCIWRMDLFEYCIVSSCYQMWTNDKWKFRQCFYSLSMNNHLPPHPHPWGTIVLNHYVTVPVTVKFIINTMWTWYIRLKKPSCVSNATRHKNTDYIFKTVAKSTFPVSFEKTGRITRASEQQLFLKLENLSFSIFKRESRILYLMYNCI